MVSRSRRMLVASAFLSIVALAPRRLRWPGAAGAGARPPPPPRRLRRRPPRRAAPPAPKVDSGDTAWVLTSSALVLMMTAPGLALFYGGMVRRKNVLATLMQSFILMALISVQWVLFGYSLAFGPDLGGIVGSLQWIGLSGVGVEPNADYAATIPHQAFMVFQLMFAIITPALITGTFAERIKFSAFLLFSLLWATLIYAPLAHWVWAVGGWIRGLGALDFAGGTVVHISSGVSALAAALVIGRRRGYGREPMPPHNLPFTVIGAAMLWVGWFGFNAGSALGAGGLAVTAFVTTNTAAAAATLAWMLAEWGVRGKPTVLGAASGRRRGARRHHAGRGLRRAGLVDPDRHRRRRALLRRLQPEVEVRVRRQPRRRRRPRRRRHVGRDRDRPLRLQGHQRGGRRRPLRREPRAPRLPAPRGGRRRGCSRSWAPSSC